MPLIVPLDECSVVTCSQALSRGNYSFIDMITQKRMKIAHILLESTEMTLKEISEYVGYGSYSGFYKAFRKTEENKED